MNSENLKDKIYYEATRRYQREIEKRYNIKSEYDILYNSIVWWQTSLIKIPYGAFIDMICEV